MKVKKKIYVVYDDIVYYDGGREVRYITTSKEDAEEFINKNPSAFEEEPWLVEADLNIVQTKDFNISKRD